MPDLDEDDQAWMEEDPNVTTTADRLSKLRMANLVRQYLQAQNLEVLPENGLEDAVLRFVDKDDKDAIKEYVEQRMSSACGADEFSFVSDQLKGIGRHMRSAAVNEEDLDEQASTIQANVATHEADDSRWVRRNKRECVISTVPMAR
jgi:double-strand break repair protein MRE11